MRELSSLPLASLACAGLALCLAPACSDHPPDPPTAGACESEQRESFSLALTTNDDVDVLIVVDDSASMGEEQPDLAANIATIVEILERPELQLDYRLGLVTTNHGNPWCEGSSPELGALQLRSCRSHLEDFVGEGEGAASVDATASCTAVCPETWAAIETLPTSAQGGDSPRPRPWIESSAGNTNLPAGLSPTQALQCVGPQGLGGCGFESPLEALWQAVQRSNDPADPSFGFLREHATLLVVFVTDEDDCSYEPAWQSIFSPEGNRVFWSDQDAAAPTSAVCWNAGVSCTGTDGEDGECHAVDRDVDGNLLAEEDADARAVLRPVSRYVELLQELEDRKRQIFPSQEVLVSVVSGANSDGSVTYADSPSDPGFQQQFGMGPGCQSAAGRALPPVRLRALAEAFQVRDDRNLFSICDADYGEHVLGDVAERLVGHHQPLCIPACVADMDRSTPDVLDPSCTLVQEAPTTYGSFEDVEIPPCEAGEALPAGHDVCYVMRTGDAVDDYCRESGYALEYGLVRREGVDVPPGTGIRAECVLSGCPDTDCPDLQ